MRERQPQGRSESSDALDMQTGLQDSDINSDSVIEPSEPSQGYTPDSEHFPLDGPLIGGGSVNGELPYEEPVLPGGLLPLSDLAPIVDYDPSHLRRLLDQGRVKGVKVGDGRRGIWLTTEQAVREYQARGNNNHNSVGRPRRQLP
jgi:hypothetical protein